jgi:pilus assembly protein CpaB
MGTRIKLIVAVFLGLFAALMVIMYLQAKEQEYMGRGALVPVMVAATDLQQWTKIEERHLAVKHIPEAYKQPGGFLEQDKAKILGQVAVAPIARDEQVITTKLAEGKEQSLAAVLAASGEKRTVTISIGNEAGVAGMLRPTDYVDIIGLFSYNVGGRRVEEIRYFEQNVLILALDQQMTYLQQPKTNDPNEKTNFSYGTATLAVSPENALRILLASKLGQLYFTLRPAGDARKPEVIEPFTAEKLLGNAYPIWREADERRSFLSPEVLKNLQRTP